MRKNVIGKRVMAGVMCAAVLALTACQGGQRGNAPANAQTTGGQTKAESEGGASEAGTTKAEASKEQASKEPEVIKEGAMATLKPFVYTDDNDKIIGFDIDMMNAIDERLEDYTFQYEDLQFSALFVSLQTGAVDMLTGTISRSPEREAEYLVPATDSGSGDSSLVTPDSVTDVNTFEDLAGKKIPMDPGRFE